MAYSFRPRTGTVQSGSVRTPLNELMQTGSEVTASEAIRILEDDASRVADSGSSKVTDSAKCLSEDVQLQQEMVSADHIPIAPNATSTTTHTHNAFPNLTLAPNAPMDPARSHVLGTRPKYRHGRMMMMMILKAKMLSIMIMIMMPPLAIKAILKMLAIAMTMIR